MTIEDQPNVDLGADTVTCGFITLDAGSSVAGQSFVWAPNGEITQTITAASSGMYSVNVYNASGLCSVADSLLVTVGAAPDTTVTATGNLQFCGGDSLLLTAAAGQNYQWVKGGSILPSETGQQITVDQSGTYSALISNVGGAACTMSSRSFVVNVNALPDTALTLSGPATFCMGDSISIAAVPGSSYTWFDGTTALSNTDNALMAMTTGDYYVVIDNGSCIGTTRTINVTVNSLPTIGVSATPMSVCAGDSVEFTASGATVYAWELLGSPTFSVNGSSFTADDMQSTGTYISIGTDANGCENSDSVTVTVNALPTIAATSSDDSICLGESVVLSVAGGTSYSWTEINSSNVLSTSSSYSPSPTSSTTFVVTGDDANSCSARDTIAVTVNTPPVVNLGADTIVCGSLKLTAAGQGSGNSFSWAPNGQTTRSLTVSATGQYSVEVTGANSCSGFDTIDVTITPGPVVDLGQDTSLCPGDQLTLDAGNTGATYLWSDGTSGQTSTASAGDTAFVSVSLLGCTVTDSMIIGTSPVAQGSFTFTASSGGFDFLPTLQSSDFSYSWDFGDGNTSTQMTPSHTYAATGSYTVTLQVFGPCGTATSTETIVISSISDSQLSQSIRLWPNPTQGVVTVALEGYAGTVEVTVTDALGRLVQQREVTQKGEQFELDLSGQAKGMYLIKFSTEQGVAVKRVIVQ